VLKTKGVKFQEVTVNPGEALFSKGDKGGDIYLTRAGTFEVWDDDLFLGSIPPGDCVGEMSALLHPGMPRSATVRCRSVPNGKCEAMRMPASVLAKLRRENPMVVKRLQERADSRDMHNQALQWLHKVPIFKEADSEFVRHVAENLRPTTVQKGEVLMLQGEPGDEMYILRNGAADVFVAESQPQHDVPESYGQKVGEVSIGGIVGEIGVVFHASHHSATVVASHRSDLLTLSKGQFSSLLDQFPNEAAQIKKLAEQRLRQQAVKLDA